MLYGDGGKPRYWRKRSFDRDVFDELLDEMGTDEQEVEYLCHLHAGRFEELDERGYDPFAHELYRISQVLDMGMGELFERTFPEA